MPIVHATGAHRRPQERDDTQFNQVVERAIGTTYNFACRARQDTYNVRVAFIALAYNIY